MGLSDVGLGPTKSGFWLQAISFKLLVLGALLPSSSSG